MTIQHIFYEYFCNIFHISFGFSWKADAIPGEFYQAQRLEMRATSRRSLMTDLAAVRKLLAKKVAAEEGWHGWTAAFGVHEDLRCISLEIQSSEMQKEMAQLREAVDMNQEQPKSEGLGPEPRVLRLRGGMHSSWDVIAG